MLTRKKLLSQLIVLAIGGTASAYSGADEKKDAVTLQKVTVTAQKREETAQEVPTPISVLSGADLLDAGIGKGSNQVLNYVPNASAATGGDLHVRPRWWIRGVGTGVQSLDSPNPVGIYLDDVYISNASATAGPLFDLDRVEVLRGPQGTLWGKNTTGGAINFISKKPSFTPDGYVKFDYGTYNDRTADGAYGGAVDDETIAARASFHTESRDGRFYNNKTGDDDASYTDSAYRLQLLDEITPDLEALVNLHFRKYSQDGASSTVTGTGVNGAYLRGYIPDPNPNHVNTNAPNSSDTTQNGALLNLKWQLGRYALTSISGYEDFKNTTFTDSDYTPLELSRGWSDQKSRQLSEELRLTSPREDRWNWVGGLHYLHEIIDSESVSAKLPGIPIVVAGPPAAFNNNFSDTSFTHTTQSFAVFGSTTYNFTDDLSVTGGLRWTSESKKLDWRRLNNTGTNVAFNDITNWWRTSSVSTPLVASATDDGSHSWQASTWDVTPEYKITEHARVYAKLARGFRSGGYNTAATSQAAINQIVKPEILTSYELGVKSEWFDGRLNANANIFKYDYENIQVNVVGPLPTSNGVSVSYLQNVKQGKASGAEFELEAIPLENLHLNASLGILNTKFTDFDVPSGYNASGGVISYLDYSGNRFVRSPHYSGVLGFDYNIPLSTGAKVVVGGDWKYQSLQYYFTTNQNDTLLGTGGFTLGNARVSYITANNKITLTGYVNNISDKVYRDHALPGSATATGDTSIYGLPRTGGVSVTARW